MSGIINARTFYPDGPSYEEVFNLKITKDYNELTEEDLAQLKADFIVAISKVSRETTTHYTSEGLRLIMDEAPIRSFSTAVWVISAVLASELIFKLVLNRDLPRKRAPDMFMYDYLRYLDLAKKGRKRDLREQVTAIVSNGQTTREKVSALMKLMF